MTKKIPKYQQIWKWRDNNPDSTLEECYKAFSTTPKNTTRTNFNSYSSNIGDISPDILVKNIDTIKEMEYAIQQIKDPVKRCENLSRLHAMKLKPLPNNEEKSLEEWLGVED